MNKKYEPSLSRNGDNPLIADAEWPEPSGSVIVAVSGPQRRWWSVRQRTRSTRRLVNVSKPEENRPR
jgi:hypothetical protein